ncbi:hypothetical protein EBZ80_18470 [bacterium]|nr:hypothetical protein [bacterium]
MSQNNMTSMKPLILFYGNCQMHALMQIMSPVLRARDCDMRCVPCFLPDIIDEAEFTELVSRAAVIVTQPIRQGYRGKSYLHTQFVIDHADANARVFVCPSVHFAFYHFDSFHGPQLPNTLVYHFRALCRAHAQGKTPAEFMAQVLRNPEWRTEAELLEIAADNIAELRRREEQMRVEFAHPSVTIVPVADFFAQHFRHHLLMHTLNHPGKFVLQHLVTQILTSLQYSLDVNTDIDPLSDSGQCLLYECVRKVMRTPPDVAYDATLPKLSVEGDEAVVEAYYASYDQFQTDTCALARR